MDNDSAIRTGKDLVRRHFDEMWNGRDLDVCDEIMAETLVEHAVAPFASACPGSVNGPEAMRGTCTWLFGQFPDLTMTVDRLVVEDDIVAALVCARGTNTGKLNGFLPPSGRRFEYLQTHWFRFADGKLCEHWATRDDLSAMLQLGVVTTPRLSALSRQLRAAVAYRLRRR